MVVTNAENILYNLWEMYGKSIEKFLKQESEKDNSKLIEEFFFIVLGGFGISYELNQSALNVLKQKSLLSGELFDSNEKLETTIELLKKEFTIKQFEPKTKNNEFRKYRFIETKPITVSQAGYWLWNECQWNISNKINTLNINSRDWLCNCPGFGLKSASWYLRNTGYNFDYAVLDVHVLRFISKIGIEVPNTITEKSYLFIENALRELCNKIGVALGKMDYLIWTLGREGYLDYVRCEE